MKKLPATIPGCTLRWPKCGQKSGHCPLSRLRQVLTKALGLVGQARVLEGPTEVTSPVHNAEYCIELALQSARDCCHPERSKPQARD